MKFCYLLVVGFFVASLSAYVINDDLEKVDETDIEDLTDDSPAIEDKAATANAADTTGPQNPTENKANAEEEAAPGDKKTAEEKEETDKKTEEKTEKAASKSNIEPSEPSDSSGDEQSDSTAVDDVPVAAAWSPEESSSGEESETDTYAQDQDTVEPEENEESPDNNGRPDEVSNHVSEDNEQDEREQAADEEAPAQEEGDQENAEACNIKFKKVGCYKSTNKGLGFQTFLKADPQAVSFTKKGKVADKNTFNDRLPQMVCDCAKEALKAGNAVFSLKNIAECWTGPDNTVFDKEGPSKKCITFDNEACDTNSELCSGKKHASFVYFVDTPEHTKTKDEIEKELEAEEKKKKKAATHAKKAAEKQKKQKKDKKKHH